MKKTTIDTIGGRIRQIRRQLHMTCNEFGARIGLSGKTVSALELDDREPGEQTIRLICTEFNVYRRWLETGVGDHQLNDPVDELSMRRIVNLLKERPAGFYEQLLKEMRRNDETQILEE